MIADGSGGFFLALALSKLSSSSCSSFNISSSSFRIFSSAWSSQSSTFFPPNRSVRAAELVNFGGEFSFFYSLARDVLNSSWLASNSTSSESSIDKSGGGLFYGITAFFLFTCGESSDFTGLIMAMSTFRCWLLELSTSF